MSGRGLALVVALALAVPARADRVLVEGVAALVDRRVITRSQVDAEGRMILVNRVGARGAQSPVDAAFKKSVLEFIVVQELLVAEARRRGITARENEVDRGLAAFQALFDSEAEYRAFLVEIGVDDEDVRNVIRRDQTVDALFAEILTPDAAIPERVAVYVAARFTEVGAGLTGDARAEAIASWYHGLDRDRRFSLLVETLRASTEIRIVADYGA